MTLAVPQPLAAPEPISDPLAAFWAQDPTILRPPASAPTAIAHDHHERIAWEIAAAVLVAGTVIRHQLAQQRPEIGQEKARAKSLWQMFAPSWLRLTVPAIRQAYALGRVEGLTDDELTALATDYARGIGDYLDETSADAIEKGMNAQLAQRWDPAVAYHRATAGYGLDRRDMGRYILAATRDKSIDPIPAAARALVDKAFLLRAERIGVQESYSATQSGQAVAWLWLERQGRLPAGCTREWEMGASEQHCVTCSELALQRVPLAQPFVLKGGAKVWAPRLHPGCTCRVRLNPPEITMQKALVSVAGLALVAADTGRVLMLQRAHDPKDPAGGTWEFPGGHLERGEAALDGARREWQEEVGRRLPSDAQLSGQWRAGIYGGFVLRVHDETCVPTHRRGSIVNPDDPDHDQVEAIAWWDPKHLTAANPSLRRELRDTAAAVRRALLDTSIAKAYDPRERRDQRGRWAEVAEPEHVDVPQEGQPSPLRDSPLNSSPLRHSAFLNPLRTPNPLKAASPLKAPFTSPFLEPEAPLRQRPRALQRRVTIIGLPNRRDPRPGRDETYWLGVDDFHLLADRSAIGAIYDIGGMVDFNSAASRPVASANSHPWQALASDQILGKAVPEEMSREDLHNYWANITKPAWEGWRQAIAKAESPDDPLVERLTSADLGQIYRLAGWEDEQNTEVMRSRIVRSVRNLANAEASDESDSLAHAYADYVTYVDPMRLLGGDLGRRIDEALDDAEGARMEVRRSVGIPLPVEQVFGFEEGFHPGTAQDDGEAMLEGPYAPYVNRYRSALADYGGSPPPMLFGLRETYLIPLVKHGDFWAPPGAETKWRG